MHRELAIAIGTLLLVWPAGARQQGAIGDRQNMLLSAGSKMRKICRFENAVNEKTAGTIFF